jgi:peptidoglycan/xylan/chitin deacetylase (PgdA/CDA1 family)
MIKKRIIIVILVIFTGLTAGYFYLSSKYVVPILMYHSINEKGANTSKLIVSPGTFRAQMEFLVRRGYNIISLTKLTELLKEKRPIPPKTLAITIDDGYKDNYSNVYPVLKEFKIPATIFIAVNNIGQIVTSEHFKDAVFMSWDEIKDIALSGLVEIGSHSMSHRDLRKVTDAQELIREVSGSKNILEEALGVKINCFSYPVGSFDNRVRDFVMQAGYLCAVGTNPGKKSSWEDVFVLKRIRVSEKDKNLFLFWWKTTGFATFFKERHDK